MKKVLIAIIFTVSAFISNAQMLPPYSQDFETATFPPSGWQLFSSVPSKNWVRDTSASGFGVGKACTSFDNFNNSAGSYHGIRLPEMNFKNVQKPYMSFDIAYAKKETGGSDMFAVYWSDNGTSNWQLVKSYTGTALVTGTPTNNLFTPKPSEWQKKYVSLATLKGKQYVRLAIEDDCNHVNKLYFDNVVVFDSATVGIEEIVGGNRVNVYPNPSNSLVRFQSDIRVSKIICYSIIGSQMIEIQLNSMESEIDISQYPNGIYLFRIDFQNGRSEIKKVLKY